MIRTPYGVQSAKTDQVSRAEKEVLKLMVRGWRLRSSTGVCEPRPYHLVSPEAWWKIRRVSQATFDRLMVHELIFLGALYGRSAYLITEKGVRFIKKGDL